MSDDSQDDIFPIGDDRPPKPEPLPKELRAAAEAKAIEKLGIDKLERQTSSDLRLRDNAALAQQAAQKPKLKKSLAKAAAAAMANTMPFASPPPKISASDVLTALPGGGHANGLQQFKNDFLGRGLDAAAIKANAVVNVPGVGNVASENVGQLSQQRQQWVNSPAAQPHKSLAFDHVQALHAAGHSVESAIAEIQGKPQSVATPARSITAALNAATSPRGEAASPVRNAAASVPTDTATAPQQPQSPSSGQSRVAPQPAAVTPVVNLSAPAIAGIGAAVGAAFGASRSVAAAHSATSSKPAATTSDNETVFTKGGSWVGGPEPKGGVAPEGLRGGRQSTRREPRDETPERARWPNMGGSGINGGSRSTRAAGGSAGWMGAIGSALGGGGGTQAGAIVNAALSVGDHAMTNNPIVKTANAALPNNASGNAIRGLGQAYKDMALETAKYQIVGLVSELAKLPEKVHGFAESMIQAKRNLTMHNGQMSLSLMKLDSERFGRDNKLAAMTAGSTDRVTQSHSRLEEATLPFRGAVDNVANRVVSAIEDAATTTIKALEIIYPAHAALLRWLANQNAAQGKGTLPDLISRIAGGEKFDGNNRRQPPLPPQGR